MQIYLERMMEIDANKTIDYLYVQNYSTAIDTCIEVIGGNHLLKHLFLDLAFTKDQLWA